MIKLSPYTSHFDDRGAFTGITREPWAEVNFVETGAGQIRGDHYHRDTLELFYIIDGEIEIEIRNVKTGSGNSFLARNGDIFIVEPYEIHTFKARTDARWINMLSQPLDEKAPDFHREGPGEKG